jgi:hypothetical protein
LLGFSTLIELGCDDRDLYEDQPMQSHKYVGFRMEGKRHVKERASFLDPCAKRPEQPEVEEKSKEDFNPKENASRFPIV